jgi:hypothetical protein
MMVIVGFQARVRSVGLAWLKSGFRHCFAYQRADRGWLLCDPLACGLLLRSAPDVSPRTLLTSLAALGATVVAVVPQPNTSRLSPLRPLTCVEVCKRLIGRRAARVVTPHQLFRELLEPSMGVDSLQE